MAKEGGSGLSRTRKEEVGRSFGFAQDDGEQGILRQAQDDKSVPNATSIAGLSPCIAGNSWHKLHYAPRKHERIFIHSHVRTGGFSPKKGRLYFTDYYTTLARTLRPLRRLITIKGSLFAPQRRHGR